MRLENWWAVYQAGWFFIRIEVEPNPIQHGATVRMDTKVKTWIDRKLYIKYLILGKIMRFLGFSFVLQPRQIDGSSYRWSEESVGELYYDL